ncbi:hypothetical protein CFE53_01015 [Methanofervidicoccus sp. A16]|uniref:hypothetical protein n=1 Tax=Methanofervidicoccus sp. A16 TaxID=2607662 RepID=UPI001189B2A1|nr:hypothetical protein [Methanofervidicoccus sp. A16]AXI24817.1 hypothetical protein CFE53_01015 [Methanofervidicoccus sp. A16]MBW9220540.1 hypothetical protein [Methanothermococcus sp. SCGC AD-155-N22]
MKYKLMFLLILTSSVVFLSTLTNDVKLFLILLLITFLLLYSLLGPYYNKKIQNNLDIILYLGIGIFTVIVFQKVLEILSR